MAYRFGTLQFTFNPADLGTTGRVPKGQTGAGRFTKGWQAAKDSDEVLNRVKDEFHRLAQQIQDRTADNIEAKRKRDGGTGRLDRATRDARNRRVFQTEFQVGIPDFLDRSAAKYWRQIEEGYKGHVGRTIYGAFADADGWAPPKKALRGRGTSFFQPGKMRAGGDSGKWLSGKGVISKPIRPVKAYRDAWRELDVNRRSIAIVQAAIHGG